MASTLKRQYVHRSSRTGQFVTPKFAKRHKSTTQREYVLKPAKARRRRSKL